MPVYFIRTVNSGFESRDDGFEYPRAEDALSLGIEAAIGIASDEIIRGERSAAVEISVERDDGTKVLRSVLATSVSPLSTAAPIVPAND